jgi:chemotaxis response regulator CheB
MMTRVLIVDDQRTAREVMEIAVKQSKKYSIVKTIMDAGGKLYTKSSGSRL